MQDLEWHPEGDVWTHTKYVVDEAVSIARREALSDEQRLIIVLAALCHDLGKALTSFNREGRWVSPGHAEAGLEPSESLLKRIYTPHHLIQAVKPLVAEHMTHINPLSPKAVRRLALRLEPNNIETLALLIEADASGRPPLAKGLPDGAMRMLELAKDLDIDQESPKPILLGRYLLELSQTGDLPARYLRGGPHFSKLLNKVFQAQLDGDVISLEEAKQLAVDLAKPED
jgi:tRNA nucleotidyltransferase (CCA-adding enzyme)